MRTSTEAFAEALGRAHTIATRVEVLQDGDSIQTIDEVIDGTVTLDSTAQVRGRADLTIVDDGTLGLVPTTASSSLAPYGNELRVSRGIALPSGPELIGLGVFRLDDVDIQDTGSGLAVVIAGMDRSARFIDARFETPYQVDAGTNYTTAILAVLQDAWSAVPYDFTATSRTTPQLVAEEGSDRWAFAQEMAKAIGMALYFDGDGVCVLRPVATTAVAAELVEGDDGLLLAAARAWSRQGTFNKVIATGENTGESAPARGEALDNNPLSPTYYYGPFGKVPRFYASSFITTDDQADDAAAAILARELGTTQRVGFGTIVDPRLEPDDVIRVTRQRVGIDENNVIDQITIPLSAQAAMTGRTRATVVSA